jgi:hypothetical protein
MITFSIDPKIRPIRIHRFDEYELIIKEIINKNLQFKYILT